MILIICVDKDYGMMFNHRRLSYDKNVMMDMAKMINQDRVYMNRYSYDLYQNLECENIVIDEELDKKDGYYLIENQTINNLSDFIKEVVVYNWNRKYPADLYFPFSLLEGWNIKECYEFKGSSHDIITKTIYERKIK